MKKDDLWFTDDNERRIETLLWGGDEIIWVVPAWKGLETLGFFYNQTIKKNWNYEGAELRHAAGLVFCHHNAPIHRITHLVKYKLAEKAKEKDRKQNLFAYEVLESFDHVSGDFEDYRNKRSPAGARPDSLILNGENIQNVLTEATKLLPHLSRRKLHKLTHKIIKPDWPPTAEERNDIYSSMKEGLPPTASTALDNIKPLLGGEDACWLHLSALWDYLV
ncbi:MAG: hypothetical protein IPM55_18840 [Acidobacteria bacterium]|nr:hypothetical protein [Acidobacteriota bacterium]